MQARLYRERLKKKTGERTFRRMEYRKRGAKQLSEGHGRISRRWSIRISNEKGTLSAGSGTGVTLLGKISKNLLKRHERESGGQKQGPGLLKLGPTLIIIRQSIESSRRGEKKRKHGQTYPKCRMRKQIFKGTSKILEEFLKTLFNEGNNANISTRKTEKTRHEDVCNQDCGVIHSRQYTRSKDLDRQTQEPTEHQGESCPCRKGSHTTRTGFS